MMSLLRIASSRGPISFLAAMAWLGLLAPLPAAAGLIPGELIQRLVAPWPPAGWSETLDLPAGAKSEPYRSEPRVRQGYFGQTLYRLLPGTSQHWTANVLIQDRGDSSAAWRAVSAVRCPVRVYQGYRARECTRGPGLYGSSTLHYEVGRFYVTLMVSGPGETDYPAFEIAGADPGDPRSPFDTLIRRGLTRSAP